MKPMTSYNWLETLLRRVAERGREMVRKGRADRGEGMALLPRPDPVELLLSTCKELLSESGEACGTALAEDTVEHFAALDKSERYRFFLALAREFEPDPARVSSSFEAWMSERSAKARSALMSAIEGERQRLFRRMNMAPGGTRALVELRKELNDAIAQDGSLQEVENDLRHLLASWFNRGFLDFQKINWETPADILEKLIAYEAVHEVNGWEDLRRRLAPDRRCYAFFHPALPREPLIFVEVALQHGITTAVAPILASPVVSPMSADTAIFYSISNCQQGLKGINFGNFLIKQVVDELQREIPQLHRFSTLSPIPMFRNWLANIDGAMLRDSLGHAVDTLRCLAGTSDDLLSREFLMEAADEENIDPAISELLARICAYFLCELPKGPVDPVARFHLSNGARLERINIGADQSAKGRMQSFGLMVNYLYEPEQIVGNHVRFASTSHVARSKDISALLANSSEQAPAARMLVK